MKQYYNYLTTLLRSFMLGAFFVIVYYLVFVASAQVARLVLLLSTGDDILPWPEALPLAEILPWTVITLFVSAWTFLVSDDLPLPIIKDSRIEEKIGFAVTIVISALLSFKDNTNLYVVLVSFTGWLFILYPFIAGLCAPLRCIKRRHPKDSRNLFERLKGEWHLFSVRGSKTSYLTYGDLELWFAIYGFGSPRFEVEFSGYSDDLFNMSVHTGLFGIAFGSNRFYRMRQSHICSTYTTGFSVNCESVSLYLLADTMGMGNYWKGWSKCWLWMRLLKGKELFEIETCAKEEIAVNTIPRSGYETESVLLEVATEKNTWSYSRWPGSKSIYRYEVVSKTENCLRVPGKGENSWDCDDEYGIDISLPHTERVNSPQAAAEYTMEYIDELRTRR